MRLPSLQIIIEQFALLFASLIWTVVVLSIIIMMWAYQDVRHRWELVLSAPPEALAQVQTEPTHTPTATETVWAPPPTNTATPPQPPTPTPTRVVSEPSLLPETLNPEDPLPVIVHDEAELADYDLERPAENGAELQTPVATPIEVTPTSTPVIPTATPLPPTPIPPTATPTIGLEQALLGTPTPAPAPQAASSSTGVPTYLQIPSVGIDSAVVNVGWDIIEQNGKQYSIWQVADFAVGWHQTTAPLGQPGNTVMAGHHNVQGEVFRDLVNVEVGDRITAYADGQPHEYIVDLKTIVKEKGESLEVRQKNAQWIAPTDDERLTLVTCWPYTNNTHRVIVVARPL